MSERDSKDYSGPIPVKVVDRRWWARQDAGENTPAAEPELKPTYVEDLERQLKEKNDLLQQYMTRYKQAADEFEAVKARMRRDINKDVERGRRVMLVEMLDVLDNLERAVDAARASRDAEGPFDSSTGSGPPRATSRDDFAQGRLVEGVELVRRQFLAKLEGFGVRRIDPVGAPFSPDLHEAVSTVPTEDPAQDGVVIGVVRPGYQIGDELLRPALVAVAKAGSSPES